MMQKKYVKSNMVTEGVGSVKLPNGFQSPFFQANFLSVIQVIY